MRGPEVTIKVPARYAKQVQRAAQDTGIPEAVIAAQLELESSWNPRAVSPAGAQGLAQFMPGTWKTYGHGSPFDPDQAIKAYARYMKALLRQEKGSLRKALAAYNAGPGNLSAGYGYADSILKSAKSKNVTIDQGSPGSGSDSGGVFSWPGEIIGFFRSGADTATESLKFLRAFSEPSTYVRIGSGFFGIVFIIMGIVALGISVVKER